MIVKEPEFLISDYGLAWSIGTKSAEENLDMTKREESEAVGAR